MLLHLFSPVDPNEETNLAAEAAYADILSTMIGVINGNASSIVSFSTSGRCSEAEAVVNGDWVLGCCSDTNF